MSRSIGEIKEQIKTLNTELETADEQRQREIRHQLANLQMIVDWKEREK